MKSAKSLAIFAVCAISVVGFASCGNEQQTESGPFDGVTTAQVYSKMQEQLAAYESNFTETAHYDIAMDIGGTMTMDMKMDSVIKIDGEKFYEKDDLDTGGLLDTSAELWYVDGVMYIQSDGYSYKTAVDTETLYSTYGVGNTDVLPEISENTLNGATLVEEEGGAAITVTVPGDEALDGGGYIAANLSNMGIEASNIVLSDVVYVFHISEEYVLRSMELDYEYSVDMYGYTYKYTHNGTITFSDIGTTSVTNPTGNFIDLDSTNDSDLI